MASLETLIKAKVPAKGEENLETGRIYSFAWRAIHILSFVNVFVGVPTATGTVTIEMWGAGGSWC